MPQQKEIKIKITILSYNDKPADVECEITTNQDALDITWNVQQKFSLDTKSS